MENIAEAIGGREAQGVAADTPTGAHAGAGADTKAGTKAGAKPETNLFGHDFVRANFAKLTDNAIQDLTRYVSGWSIYSIHFLNAVAQMQGVAARLDNETIVALRRGAKRATAPDLVPLLRDAGSVEEMEIERIVNLIREEAGQGAK